MCFFLEPKLLKSSDKIITLFFEIFTKMKRKNFFAVTCEGRHEVERWTVNSTFKANFYS